MQYDGVDKSAIDKRFKVISGDDVVELLMSANGSLLLT